MTRDNCRNEHLPPSFCHTPQRFLEQFSDISGMHAAQCELVLARPCFDDQVMSNFFPTSVYGLDFRFFDLRVGDEKVSRLLSQRFLHWYGLVSFHENIQISHLRAHLPENAFAARFGICARLLNGGIDHCLGDERKDESSGCDDQTKCLDLHQTFCPRQARNDADHRLSIWLWRGGNRLLHRRRRCWHRWCRWCWG